MNSLNLQIKKLWDLDEFCKNQVVCNAGKHLHLWLTEMKDDKIAQYICGQDTSIDYIESLSGIESKIIAHFTPLPESTKYLKALLYVVEKGNELGVFNVPPPNVYYFIKPEKSPFQSETHQRLPLTMKWRETICNDPMKEVLTDKEMAGRILLSAIFNGGLYYNRSLAALYLKLVEPLEAIIIKDAPGSSNVYYDLVISYRNTPVKRLIRWFPDNFTEILLLSFKSSKTSDIQYHSTGDKRLQAKIFICIKSYLSLSNLSKQEMPKSLNALLEAAKYEGEILLNGYLCNFASGSHLGHSLKDYAWKRIFGLMKVTKNCKEVPVTPITHNEADEEPDENIEKEEVCYYDYNWKKEIRSALNNFNRTVALKGITLIKKKFENDFFSFAHIMSGWIRFLLSKPSANQRKLSIKTIRGYFGSVSQRLADYSSGTDITLLENDGLEEIYTQILADIESPSYRNKIAAGLREFHHYLVQEFHLEPINYTEVLGIVSADRIVDANIITFDEYYKILDAIESYRYKWAEIYHEDLTDIVKLIVILGFRCGCRRSEALKLLLDDVQLGPSPSIIIRPNFAHTLKTKSSVRTLPIYYLLSKSELVFLTDFLERRKKAEKDKTFSAFLFAIPSLFDEVASEVKVFKIIQGIMREVTGDMSLKFHHLRHSFATWLMVRFFIKSFDDKEKLLGHLPITARYLSEAQTFSSNLLKTSGPSKKYVRAVASLLGHSGPDSSISHYIHLSDFILKKTLERRITLPERKTFVDAAFVPRSTAQRWYKEGGHDGFMQNIRKKASSRILINTKIKSPAAIPQDIEEDYASEVRYTNRVWEYFTQAALCNQDLDTVCKRLNLKKEKIEKMYSAAVNITKVLAKNKSGRTHPPHKKFFLGKNTPPQELPGCPRKSEKTETHVRIVGEYLPKIWKGFAQNEQRAKALASCFLKNSRSTTNYIIFHGMKEAEDALLYLNFLINDLNIKKSKISIVTFDNKQRSTYKSQWRKKLGLSVYTKINVIKNNLGHENKSVRSWLGIRPTFFKEPNTGSSAFRWALIMVIICLRLYPRHYENRYKQ